MRGAGARSWSGLVAMSVLGSGLLAAPAVAEAVRPLQPRGARLIEEGTRRCETLRVLVEAIAASDLVVYVDLEDHDPNGSSRVGAHMQFAGAGATARFLRVWLQPRRTDGQLIALLAHELQHAVEVAAAPDVRSPAAFRALYAAAGRSDRPGRFCTSAAEQVTALVARELDGLPKSKRPRDCPRP